MDDRFLLAESPLQQEEAGTLYRSLPTSGAEDNLPQSRLEEEGLRALPGRSGVRRASKGSGTAPRVLTPPMHLALPDVLPDSLLSKRAVWILHTSQEAM